MSTTKSSIQLFREWLEAQKNFTKDEICQFVKNNLLAPHQNKLELLRLECKAWGFNVFGADKDCTGEINHLKEECDEILRDPSDMEEWADALILLLNGFSRQFPQCDATDLLFAGFLKMEKNKKRQWGTPDEKGIVRHIKTQEEVLEQEAKERFPDNDGLHLTMREVWKKRRQND